MTGFTSGSESLQSLFFSIIYGRRVALTDGKYSHNGYGPLDHGREKRWVQNRPVNHDGGFLSLRICWSLRVE